jgi:hypothetical protein
MNPMTFVFVVTILYTVRAFLNLVTCQVLQFVIWTGMAIWGWKIYCS